MALGKTDQRTLGAISLGTWSLGAGVAVFTITNQLGFNESTTAHAFGADINGELAKWIWTIIAALAPMFVSRLPEWMRPIVEKLIEVFLPQETVINMRLNQINDVVADCPQGRKACATLRESVRRAFHPDPEEDETHDP